MVYLSRSIRTIPAVLTTCVLHPSILVAFTRPLTPVPAQNSKQELQIYLILRAERCFDGNLSDRNFKILKGKSFFREKRSKFGMELNYV